MNHKLFEEWILQDGPPPQDERLELQEHLQECGECRQLADAWRSAELQLRRASQAAPAAGFTARWQARLAADQQRLQRRQSLAVLAFALGAAALLLGSLLLVAIPAAGSWNLYFWSWLYRLLQTAAVMISLPLFLLSLLRAASQVVPLAGWVLAAGVMCQMMVLWVVSLRMLTQPRRIG
jgi:predicted anti-sigma-YlaC factor YlaD